METIYKYPIRSTGCAEVQRLFLPAGAQLLTVASQPVFGEEVEKLFLWARVDTEKEWKERFVVVCGTGQPLGPYKGDLKFISTFFEDPGRVTGIGHAFELLPVLDRKAESTNHED